MKDCMTGKAGQIMVAAYCPDCKFDHWIAKYPCDCKKGKIQSEYLDGMVSFVICGKCNGRGWVNA
jgi:hypothetical protein